MKYEGKIYGMVAGKYIQLDVNPNLVDAAPELLEALKEVLATGINGGNNVRLAYISASHKELSAESLRKAELSEMAVLKAMKAIENAEKK